MKDLRNMKDNDLEKLYNDYNLVISKVLLRQDCDKKLQADWRSV
jgi:hypothetical protein